MSTTATADAGRTTVPDALVAPVTVTSVERLSPSFVRVEFGGDALADLGVDGPWYDQRIKLAFPVEGGPDPAGPPPGEGPWYQRWRELPLEERGHLRTYSVREVRGSGSATRLVVDLVLHLAEGASGPASHWAARARPGDRLVLAGPHRGSPWGGIEFAPPAGTGRLLLAGDETAVPAASRILADLPGDARGAAFLEVPLPGDQLDVEAPAGVAVHWLPREGGAHGAALTAAVLDHLGLDGAAAAVPGAPGGATTAGAADAPSTATETVPEQVWETPTYSTSGEDPAETSAGLPGLYAWIAGESGTVTALRRRLLAAGVARHQVAFMGYWRLGAAARA